MLGADGNRGRNASPNHKTATGRRKAKRATSMQPESSILCKLILSLGEGGAKSFAYSSTSARDTIQNNLERNRKKKKHTHYLQELSEPTKSNCVIYGQEFNSARLPYWPYRRSDPQLCAIMFIL